MPCSQMAVPPRQLPSCTEQSSSTGGPSITCEVLLLAAPEGSAAEGAAMLLGELSPEGSLDVRPEPLKTNCVDEEAPPPSMACAIACSWDSSSSGSSASSASTCGVRCAVCLRCVRCVCVCGVCGVCGVCCVCGVCGMCGVCGVRCAAHVLAHAALHAEAGVKGAVEARPLLVSLEWR